MGNVIQKVRDNKIEPGVTKMALGATNRTHDDYDADVIEQLLNKNLRVDFVDSDHATLLHYASKKGNLNLVKLLLGKGAQLEFQSKEGCTPLHLAAEQQRVAVCEYLLKKGANPNARDHEGLTPMHHVCQTAFSSKILSLMIKKGAKADALLNDGRNGLHLIAKKMQFPAQLNQSKICLMLLDNGCPVDVKDNKSLTPLHYAALNGQFELCKILIDNGAFIGAQAQDGRTALHMAAEYDHYNVAESLLERGSYVNAQGIDKSTPLHVAAEEGHPKIAKLLLFVNADPHLRNNRGETPLHVAAKHGHFSVVETILKFAGQSIDINARVSTNGATPLFLAAKYGHVSIVEILLDHGAFYNTACSFPCLTPFFVAKIFNRKSVVKLIKRVKQMLKAANKDDTDVVLSCINKGAVINARYGKDGRCALHYAALNGNLTLTEYLLSKSAKVYVVTRNGHTPLHSALARNKYELASILVRYAVNKLDHDELTRFLDARTSFRQETALHKAVKKNQLDLVKLLIRSGATYNLTNKSGSTPADLAKGELKEYFSAIDDLFQNARASNSRKLSEIIAMQPTVAHARDRSTGKTALNWTTPTTDIDSVKTVLKD